MSKRSVRKRRHRRLEDFWRWSDKEDARSVAAFGGGTLLIQVPPDYLFSTLTAGAGIAGAREL